MWGNICKNSGVLLLGKPEKDSTMDVYQEFSNIFSGCSCSFVEFLRSSYFFLCSEFPDNFSLQLGLFFIKLHAIDKGFSFDKVLGDSRYIYHWWSTIIKKSLDRYFWSSVWSIWYHSILLLEQSVLCFFVVTNKFQNKLLKFYHSSVYL